MNSTPGRRIARTAVTGQPGRAKPSPLIRVVRKTALWFASVAFAAGTLTVGVRFVRSVPTGSAGPLAIPPRPASLPVVTPAEAVAAPRDMEPVIPDGATPTAASGPVATPPIERPEDARASHVLPSDARFGVLVASFRMGTAAESRAAGRIRVVTDALETLGYRVSHVDVDLGTRGRWRRVVAGGYATRDDGRRDASQIRAVREFREAQVIALTQGAAPPPPLSRHRVR